LKKKKTRKGNRQKKKRVGEKKRGGSQTKGGGRGKKGEAEIQDVKGKTALSSGRTQRGKTGRRKKKHDEQGPSTTKTAQKWVGVKKMQGMRGEKKRTNKKKF